ncbi:MAG TPA: efflux RND transporter periplasmic adaptor subunit [Vicinamibacteria bacterium]|jgi:RND family efflux transporter MFP subunit
MTRPSDEEVVPVKKPTLRKALGGLAWALTGVLGTILFLTNPLGLRPLDRWVRAWLGHAPAGERSGATPAPSAARRGRVLFYRNPMNPSITSPVPMKDEMGMDYLPVYEGEASATAGEGASITIDPSVVQNMNVRMQTVGRRDLTREIRTVGYLEYDQQRMVTVTTKYAGFVEKVYVNYPGEPVRKGEPLFEIYSPELVQTERDLLSAIEFARRLEGAPEEARRRAQALVAAARARFAYWDIRPAQIDALESTGEVFRTLKVSAPSSGVVMKRLDGLEGMAVRPGMELFHVADLSSLWLTVEVFEDQLGWLEVGSVADISLSYFPGETFTGRVRFVEPQVSEKTRTVPLRLEVPNREGRLRSGMYATVRFHPVVARDAMVVPSLAVLRTGERNLVVVAEGAGRFAPRPVTLGSEGDGYTEVLSGLEAGDEVVTSAQFLIDSESNLREAIQKMVAAATSK